VPIIDNDALSRSTKHISEFKHAGHIRIKVAPSSTAGFEAPRHSKEQILLHIRKQYRREEECMVDEAILCNGRIDQTLTMVYMLSKQYQY
jgi:hypothetical protein